MSEFVSEWTEGRCILYNFHLILSLKMNTLKHFCTFMFWSISWQLIGSNWSPMLTTMPLTRPVAGSNDSPDISQQQQHINNNFNNMAISITNHKFSHILVIFSDWQCFSVYLLHSSVTVMFSFWLTVLSVNYMINNKHYVFLILKIEIRIIESNNIWMFHRFYRSSTLVSWGGQLFFNNYLTDHSYIFSLSILQIICS